jgi:hypothetical protein
MSEASTQEATARYRGNGIYGCTVCAAEAEGIDAIKAHLASEHNAILNTTFAKSALTLLKLKAKHGNPEPRARSPLAGA